MEPSSQSQASSYYKPKRQRKPSYSSQSACQNSYRKPSNKKTYTKKSPIKTYSISEIQSLQFHVSSSEQPVSSYMCRRLIPVFQHMAQSPKLIKSDLDEITKLFKSLLNKLTPTNFDQIYEKIKPLLTPDTSKDLSSLLLAKACQEIKYSETYAKLSKALQLSYERFRDDLLISCQQVFESDSWENCESMIEKKRLLGLVAFIGQLLNVRLLSTKVLLICCQQLLDKNNEIAAEGLCFLLSSFSTAFTGRYKELAHDMVLKLETQAKSFPARIRFLVIDLVESNKINNSLFEPGEKPQDLRSKY